MRAETGFHKLNHQKMKFWKRENLNENVVIRKRISPIIMMTLYKVRSSPRMSVEMHSVSSFMEMTKWRMVTKLKVKTL